jgi:hypothetical protein
VTVATKTYDATTTATITGCTLSGVIGSDDVTCDTATATATFAAPDAGTGIAVSVTGLSLTGGDAWKYSFGGTAATTGDIGPAPIVVTAADATVTYGDVEPVIGYTATPFLAGGAWIVEPACTTTYVRYDGVGSYPTSCSSGDAGANYAISYTDGTLTVVPRTLTVTAASPTVPYGDPAPTIGFTAIGFVNADPWLTEPTCATTYLPGGVGSFPTACTGGDAGPDYAIVRLPGVLTVTPRVLPGDAVVYTGQTIHYVNSSTATAQVTLTASIVADLPSCTESGPTIAAARVDFRNVVTGRLVAKDVPISAMDCNNGTATAFATLTAGPTGVTSYPIRVELSGPFVGDNDAQEAAEKTVVVLVALTSAGLNGYGVVDHTSQTSAYDLGTYGALHDPAGGSATVYTFNVTVSPSTKKGTPTIKGEINLFIPATRSGVEGTYFVKATAFNSVSRNDTTKTTTVFSKAVVQFLPTGGTPISIDGGASLRLDAIDNGTGGWDAVGFTVTSSKSSLLYWSNHWVKVGKAWQTVPQPVGPGAGLAVVIR